MSPDAADPAFAGAAAPVPKAPLGSVRARVDPAGTRRTA